MILSWMVGLICVAFVAFGWWTIGFPRRRMWGGLVLLVTTFLFAPWLLVMSGERYGFDGVVAGLVGLSLAIGGGFFFTTLGWTGRVRKIRKVRTLSEDPDLF